MNLSLGGIISNHCKAQTILESIWEITVIWMIMILFQDNWWYKFTTKLNDIHMDKLDVLVFVVQQKLMLNLFLISNIQKFNINTQIINKKQNNNLGFWLPLTTFCPYFLHLNPSSKRSTSLLVCTTILDSVTALWDIGNSCDPTSIFLHHTLYHINQVF